MLGIFKEQWMTKLMVSHIRRVERARHLLKFKEIR